MDIKVVCVGKLKEDYWQGAVKEYMKRLKPYANVSICELRESRLRKNAGPAEEEEVKTAEGNDILAAIGPDEYVISLEIKGKKLDSVALSDRIKELGIEGRSKVTFVIGGSLGLSGEVSKRADLKLSFSDMTFPHQMMRVILLEQIYRSFKIMRGEPYHK